MEVHEFEGNTILLSNIGKLDRALTDLGFALFDGADAAARTSPTPSCTRPACAA